jgi:transposase-like protein
MAQTKGKRAARGRRRFTEEFKREAVQMLFNDQSTQSVLLKLQERCRERRLITTDPRKSV